MQDLDEKLLSLLSQNSRQSSRALARKLGCSPSTILNKLAKLEKEGVIKAYSISVDYEKLGLDLMAVIGLTINKGALLKAQKEIARFPEVMSVYDVTGEVDSFVLVRVKNRRELSEVVKKIHSIPNVEGTNTHVVLNAVKENYVSSN